MLMMIMKMTMLMMTMLMMIMMITMLMMTMLMMIMMMTMLMMTLTIWEILIYPQKRPLTFPVPLNKTKVSGTWVF